MLSHDFPIVIFLPICSRSEIDDLKSSTLIRPTGSSDRLFIFFPELTTMLALIMASLTLEMFLVISS